MAEPETDKIDRKEIKTHVLDPERGYYVAYWDVGENITQEIIDAFFDRRTKALYAVCLYRDGKCQVNITSKRSWNTARKMMGI